MKARIMFPGGQVADIEGTPSEIAALVRSLGHYVPAISVPSVFGAVCVNEYESPWWGLNPPPCKKCGYQEPTWTVRYAKPGETIASTTTNIDSTGVRVSAVLPGSSAAEAGVRIGDYLIRVGEVTISRDVDFGPAFRARYANQPEGSPLPLTVRRDGRTLSLPARLRLAENVSYTIAEDPSASPKAVRIRDGILKGTTAR